MTFYEFIDAINYLNPAMSLLGASIGFINYKSLNVIHKGITYYLLIMLIVDLASRLLITEGNNLFILLVYSLLEMTLFVWFYFKFFFKAKHKLIIGLYSIAALYILWEIVQFERVDAKGFQSYAKPIDDFIIIILVLTFFQEKINIFKESKWDNFRLNALLLVFFSINFVFFLPLNFIISNSSGIQFYFWFGIVITTLLFYTYLTHSIWRNGRTQKLLLSGLR